MVPKQFREPRKSLICWSKQLNVDKKTLGLIETEENIFVFQSMAGNIS